jgi:hypothetical protein
MARENYFDRFFKEHLPAAQQFVHNRTVGGCSSRRPDWYIDLLTHALIVECDEDAHHNYSCENKRTMELFQDFGGRPTVFLRFNPDQYQGKSCFIFDNANVIHPVVGVFDARSQLILERIKYHLVTIPDKEVTVETLFYPEESSDGENSPSSMD